MVVRKFDCEDLVHAVLQSVKRLSWKIPVDGSEGVPRPSCVPGHELLAKFVGCLLLVLVIG